MPKNNSSPSSVDNFDEIEEINPEGASNFSSLFNLLNTILGGGALALPQAFALSGLAVGMIITIIVGFLSSLTSNLIIATATELGGIKSYKDLAIATYGVPGSLVVDVCLIFYLFGVMTGYIVIIADLLTPYIAILFDFDGVDENSNGEIDVAYGWRVLVSCLAVLFVLLPVSLLNKIEFLKYTSTFAIMCILYMVIVISVISVKGLFADYDFSELLWGKFGIDTFSAAPVIVFAFSFHTGLFPIKNEMKDPTAVGPLVASACAISGVLYMIVGVFGYMTFLECVESNVLVSFEETTPITIAKVALVVVLSFSYPLMNFACRISVWNLLFPLPSEGSCWDWWPKSVREWKNRPENAHFRSSRRGEDEELVEANMKGEDDDVVMEHFPIRYEDFEWSWHNPAFAPYMIITISLSLSALALSVLVPDIQAIFGLVGATAGSVIVFIFPGLAAIKVFDEPWYSPKIFFAWVCVVVGVAVAILGTFVSLYNWDKELMSEDC